MSVKVQLPPGCKGFDCKDGTKYTAAKSGGTVEVSDRHAEAINKGQFGATGLVTATGSESFGTKRGQQCPDCRRVWNAWNAECPRCGTATVSV